MVKIFSLYPPLSIWGANLSFKEHIQYVAKKLKVVLGFYYRNKSCFIMLKKRLVESTFLPVLVYGDVLYMCISAQLLQKLDSVYHGALRFISYCGFLTHHCSLYSKVNWTTLSVHRVGHWYVFI